MRRESATVVALVGEVRPALLDDLARSPNLAVLRAPDVPPVPSPAGSPAPSRSAGTAAPGVADAGWEAGALALRAAARRISPYVLAAADPLSGLAAEWRAMWEVTAGPPEHARFEERAAQALAAWRGGLFELPDYYLVLAADQPAQTGPDLYSGPLLAARPRRVAVAVSQPGAEQAAVVRGMLRSLAHGPWWPPLDELIDAARRYYAGGLAGGQHAGSAELLAG